VRVPTLRSILALWLLALLTSLLAIYQWIELLAIRRGGTTACSVNETINCATVWNSAIAQKLHEWSGMPIAALGLTWATAAMVLSGLLWWRFKKGQPTESAQIALKLIALAGLLSVVVFAVSSLQMGALCLTCLGTYVLVIAFSAVALTLPVPLISPNLVPGAAHAAVAAGLSFLVFLYPGLQTPHAVRSPVPSTGTSTDWDAYFGALDKQEAQMCSFARQKYTEQTARDLSAFPSRAVVGPDNAPVKLVDFTDVMCTHCRQFEAFLEELQRVAPPNALSIEARHFPLDSECNRAMKNKPWGDGIRCLGAKVQICLEGSPQFLTVRRGIFEKQNALSKEVIWDVVEKAGLPKSDIEACVNSERTQQKLEADIAYALSFKITGTPLVLVNGKEALPSPPFLIGLTVARGNADAAFFKKLPPPALPVE
jgi:protein-disulfide isomerase